MSYLGNEDTIHLTVKFYNPGDYFNLILKKEPKTREQFSGKKKEKNHPTFTFIAQHELLLEPKSEKVR